MVTKELSNRSILLHSLSRSLCQCLLKVMARHFYPDKGKRDPDIHQFQCVDLDKFSRKTRHAVEEELVLFSDLNDLTSKRSRDMAWIRNDVNIRGHV